jgi:TPP-dependent pyruvate/acetoin dehydrogenase alpha subunit
MDLSKQDQRRLFYRLLLCRNFDEKMRILFRQAKYAGTFFSCVGHEATTVVPTFLSKKEDVIGVQHRELGACFGKGVPTKYIAAQIYARKTSPDQGKSHPCHYGYPELNIVTPASTVAAQTVIVTGCALAFKLRKEPRVAIAFTGEGGTSQGAWHEACNFAGVHKLPIVFVCQNNLWAESVADRFTSAITNYSDRAKAYGFPGISIDGNDVLSVYETSKRAIEYARSGKGPILIEMKTYRWYGHSEVDPASYRKKEEVEEWKKKDPIPRFEAYLRNNGILDDKIKGEIDQEIKEEIEAAVKFADESPLPEPEEALDHVYAENKTMFYEWPKAEKKKPEVVRT